MIPTLDLQTSERSDWYRACADYGFFYLTGHAIESDLIDRAIRVSRAFFLQPASVKNQLRRTARNCWGYYDAELTKNHRDWKEILDIGRDITSGPLAGAVRQMPADVEFNKVINRLQEQLHYLALTVTAQVVSAMSAEIDLQEAFTEHTSFLRLNYYPECNDAAPGDAATDADGTFGIRHHTDAGAVTLLVQEPVTSLQVYKQNRWLTIPSHPDALIVNLGDIAQVWSNDAFRAPLHRVLAQPTSRVSIPYFLNPACSYDYAPLATQPARYRPINWGEFRAGRSAGDYANLGTEIQISDYAI